MVQQDLRKFESQALKPPFNGRPGAAGPGLGEAARRGGSQTSVSQAAGSAGGLPVPVACAAQTPRTQALPVTVALRLAAAAWPDPAAGPSQWTRGHDAWQCPGRAFRVE